MSTREAAALLEHIRANPADDAPRLVYADWLDEHGQPERAEFARVQCERARLPKWDARRIALRLRERALLEPHGKRWLKELPVIKGVTWGEFRRGFVAAATFTTFADLKQKAAKVWQAAPVDEVAVRWPRREDDADQVAPIPGLRGLYLTGTVVDMADVDRLAAAPLLGTLRELTAAECGLGVEGFRRLVASPHLTGLTALRVPFNAIGNAGIGALRRGTTLPALTELDLSEPGSYGRYGEDPIVDPAGMQALAAWPGLAQLRVLALNGNELGRDGLRALVRSPNAVGLKELAVRNNKLTGSAVAEFGEARSGLQLERLDLGENVLGELGPDYLARSSCLRGLRGLRIDRCEVPGMGAHKLAQAPFLPGLRVLDADHNGFGELGLLALLVKGPAELHTLRLADNNLGDDGVGRLVDSPAASSLVWLDLEQNELTDAAARALGGSPHLRNLLALRLADNAIGKGALAALKRSPVGKRLALLDTTEADVGDDPMSF